jgi:histidinol-phosphatase
MIRAVANEGQHYHHDCINENRGGPAPVILAGVTSALPRSTFDAPFDGDLRADLALALRLADAADAASMPRFDAADLDVRTKADATHVTEADLATERAIRSLLAAERPDDSVFGEEYGVTGESSRQWIIDPIDGTANYLKGIPMWTTLIALVIDGVPRVGVASQPAIARRWWAATGLGAWTDTPSGEPRRLAVSSIDSVAESSVSFQSMAQWRDAGELDALERLTSSVWRDRGYGDAWPYMLLAEGRLELVAEFGVQEYDIAALVPIVTEAGGRFTSFDGRDSLAARSSLATNRVLHDAYLGILHSA